MSTIVQAAEPANIRELSAAELSAVNGGVWNIDFKLLGLHFFFQVTDYSFYACVADSQSYGCVGTVGGQGFTSSGPVP